MTDEEIKAIEELKKQKESIEYSINAMECTPEDYEEDDYNDCLKLQKYADVLLNLIQKQQEELEKKDKVIEEMALWLYEDDTSFGYGNLKEINTQEKIKEYFYKKVEGK